MVKEMNMEKRSGFYTMFMVICDGKVRTYKGSQRALAMADARDYSSTFEEYRINRETNLSERVG